MDTTSNEKSDEMPEFFLEKGKNTEKRSQIKNYLV